MDTLIEHDHYQCVMFAYMYVNIRLSWNCKIFRCDSANDHSMPFVRVVIVYLCPYSFCELEVQHLAHMPRIRLFYFVRTMICSVIFHCLRSNYRGIVWTRVIDSIGGVG